MSYAFYYDTPATAHIYNQVSGKIGGPPQGMLASVVTRTDGGLRHLNVWETREQWVEFRNNRLAPIVSAVMADLGIPLPTEAPVEHELDLVDVLP